MAMMVLDQYVEAHLKAERAATGADRYDEVWEGLYVMAPLANNEHQELQAKLATALRVAVGWDAPARVLAGANVSDREDQWEHNYRCPDVLVVFPNSAARDCDTHWLGGPDFCVEITSPGDRSRDKLEFYGAVGVRELLLIDRDPWSLELYRLDGAQLKLVGRTEPQHATTLKSEVVPISLQLIAAAPRPKIEVVHHDAAQRWTV